MTRIITFTPSPALDLSTNVEKIAPYTKMRCAPARRDAGGGGINVARTIHRLGGEVCAFFPAGGATGQVLKRLLVQEGMDSHCLETEEDTRENFSVIERASGQQFRFVLPGTALTERDWQRCQEEFGRAVRNFDLVIASGSLPAGVPGDCFACIGRIAKAAGARLIVDSSGDALRAAVDAGVYLLKPNLGEFRQLTGIDSRDDASLVAGCRSLIAAGKAEIVALTMGPQGALLVTAGQALRADALKIEPKSVVGAGDSFLGGFFWSLQRGDDMATALRFGVAAGSAALLSEGTGLENAADVLRLYENVVVKAAAE